MWVPCQEKAGLKEKLYAQPSSSTSEVMSTYQDRQAQAQDGSGSCAVRMSTREGAKWRLCQPGGSKLRRPLEEKKGMPQANMLGGVVSFGL